MIAHWMSVGFAHGVCNTDNFSLHSITIDYGPFGFMEAYDPMYVPNTSDDEGMYAYAKQDEVSIILPFHLLNHNNVRNNIQVGYYNLDKLRVSLGSLLSQDNRAIEAYWSEYDVRLAI